VRRANPSLACERHPAPVLANIPQETSRGYRLPRASSGGEAGSWPGTPEKRLGEPRLARKCNTLKPERCVWDGEKADRNAREHRVRFEEAATVFSDPLALIIDESLPENAHIIGESLAARILRVVFVERDRDLVRLISARRATRHERRRY
jgi:uncharacterized DUF497 family protein